MTRAWNAPRCVTVALALAAAAGLGSCAHGTPGVDTGPRAIAPAPDSVTIGLWHMEETGGQHVGDSGPFRLDGTAGLDTRTDFGRYGRTRQFTSSLDSFIQMEYNPTLEARDGFTIEAWVWVTAYGTWEDSPIAARWVTSTGDRSWLFSIVGQKLTPPLAPAVSPGEHATLVGVAATGALMFAYVPEEAGGPRAYFSTRPIELSRWTHVAATFDGQVVRIWIDGMLDAQYASKGSIRPSRAPLQIGNTIDPHWLSTFGGDLRADQARDPNPYYAFVGMIDEVRLSSSARTQFESVRKP